MFQSFDRILKNSLLKINLHCLNFNYMYYHDNPSCSNCISDAVSYAVCLSDNFYIDFFLFLDLYECGLLLHLFSFIIVIVIFVLLRNNSS